MAQTEPPLYLTLNDRRCRRVWLLIGHLLALMALALVSNLGPWLLPAAAFWCVSAWQHWHQERAGLHPQALLWNAQDLWRLEYPGDTRSIAPPRLLRLGRCLLVEAETELFFLPPLPGSQRLRRLLQSDAG